MIPKTLHFCFGMAPDFGGKPFGLAHYVCVKSAIETIGPKEAFFWFAHEPESVWWKEILPHVTPRKIEPPETIFGNPVRHPAHRADVVRLEKLLEHGGIYLDCDVFVRKTFDDLLGHACVLARQSAIASFGVPNAVILAESNAKFLRRWYDAYRTFDDSEWDAHSVLVPLHLSRIHPEDVTVLDETAFYVPSWKAADVHTLFSTVEPIDTSKAWAHHLWETKSWRHLDRLTPGDVRRHETNFHRWAQPYVAHLPEDFGGPGLPWKKRRRSKTYLARERALQWVRDRRAALIGWPRQ